METHSDKRDALNQIVAGYPMIKKQLFFGESPKSSNKQAPLLASVLKNLKSEPDEKNKNRSYFSSKIVDAYKRE